MATRICVEMDRPVATVHRDPHRNWTTKATGSALAKQHLCKLQKQTDYLLYDKNQNMIIQIARYWQKMRQCFRQYNNIDA